MPNNQALQVFYGTIPLILVLAGIWLREQMLLKDILARLGRVEERIDRIETTLREMVKRLTVLERALDLFITGTSDESMPILRPCFK